MFSNAEIGDNVFDYIKQEWGSILNIKHGNPYPILVEFSKYNTKSYTLGGKQSLSDVGPILFWDEVKPIEPPSKPLPNLKVDTKVLVWDYKTEKNKKYFSHFDSDGKINCFTLGATSWSATGTVAWSNWELA